MNYLAAFIDAANSIEARVYEENSGNFTVELRDAGRMTLFFGFTREAATAEAKMLAGAA